MVCGRRDSLSRRQLLKSGLALAAGAVALGPRRVLGQDCPDCTRWALLSDIHIAANPENRFRGFYPYRNLQEVTAQITDNLPDGVVVTGDLARWRGETRSYECVKAMLAPISQQRPVYLGVGNHDNRKNFLRTFTDPDGVDEAGENKHIITAEAGPVRLIVLDTLLFINANPGMLGRSQRAWLEGYLQTCDDRPTILLLHHTPYADLLDTRRLFDIVRPMPKVKAIIYGHSHAYGFAQSEGVHLINLPATGFNFSDRQPVGWVEARFTQQGGEFRLHAIGGNTANDGRTTTLNWRA
jgi:3',5'-cyclic AMP phosphodiesterase CpdA